MTNPFKAAARELIPPVLFRGLRLLNQRLLSDRKPRAFTGIKTSSWYDEIYEYNSEYRKHYTESRYYFIWTVIADRIVRRNHRNIFDLGCGPGQFAALLHSKGVKGYCGLDFSSSAIEIAKKSCPDFEFIAADAFASDTLENREYDCLVTMEFLEHVDKDIEILQRVRPGTRVIATVPDFPTPSHIRYFSNSREVQERYARLFDSFRVDAFLKDEGGHTFFILDGIRKQT